MYVLANGAEKMYGQQGSVTLMTATVTADDVGAMTGKKNRDKNQNKANELWDALK